MTGSTAGTLLDLSVRMSVAVTEDWVLGGAESMVDESLLTRQVAVKLMTFNAYLGAVLYSTFWVCQSYNHN